MTGQMIVQLLAATAMVGGSILFHLAGLAGLMGLMRLHGSRANGYTSLLDQVAAIVGVGFGLFALHTMEIWAYALLYLTLGATPDLETALYFSTTTYATIGYGDLTLSRAWRILGAIEGANGVILLGWSTAFFISVVGRMRTLEHRWLKD